MLLTGGRFSCRRFSERGYRMAENHRSTEIYLEIGKSRTFAVALDWPGWARSGRDESAALQALFDYGPRYERVLASTGLGFRAPAEVSDFFVADRVEGNATTDFGAPAVELSSDSEPIDPDELQRWEQILTACWRAFDSAVAAAAGAALRKGPRGGGRDLEKIVRHVWDVDEAYLNSLGGKLDGNVDAASDPDFTHIRAAVINALQAAARGELPTRGPRGGARWTPRYFIRRIAWHELDHAWEIEDRSR